MVVANTKYRLATSKLAHPTIFGHGLIDGNVEDYLSATNEVIGPDDINAKKGVIDNDKTSA